MMEEQWMIVLARLSVVSSRSSKTSSDRGSAGILKVRDGMVGMYPVRRSER